MNSPITVVLAFLYAKPGQEEKLHNELLTVVTKTLEEPGCLRFEAHRSTDDPTKFVVYENWKERSDVDKHVALPHVQRLIGMGPQLFAKPIEVTFWKKMQP